MSTHVRSTSFAKTQITGVVWYLGVRQDVTAAREVHRHSRRKNGRNRQVVLEEDNDVYSCQRGSRTFTATLCNHHFLSTVRTVVSLWLWWCLRYIRLLSFAEGVIVFFPLSFSLTLIFSLWPPSRNRADTRREWIDFKPFNISHVLTDVPNGENFNEVLLNTHASQRSIGYGRSRFKHRWPTLRLASHDHERRDTLHRDTR